MYSTSALVFTRPVSQTELRFLIRSLNDTWLGYYEPNFSLSFQLFLPQGAGCQ